MNDDSLERIGVSRTEADGRVIRFINDGELLEEIQESPFSLAAPWAPNAVGKRYELTPHGTTGDPTYPGPVEFLDQHGVERLQINMRAEFDRIQSLIRDTQNSEQPMRLIPKMVAATTALGLLAVIGVFAIAELGELKLAGDPADVYYPDDKVEALARAAADGDVPAMKAAIAAGADVNYAGLEGFRPLYWPMHAGNKKGFSALLELGADPLLTTNKGHSLIDTAAGADDPDYLRILLENGFDPNTSVGYDNKPPIFSAIIGHRWPQLKLLLEYCYNLNWADDFGKTAAVKAASISEMKMAHYLVEQGMNHDLENLAWYVESDTTNPPEQAEYREKLMRLLEEKHAISFPVKARQASAANPPPSVPAYAESCDRKL